jgi:NAD(P)-dependent dehydrogenase (short-subunit alcohol dehydrogenase family)
VKNIMETKLKGVRKKVKGIVPILRKVGFVPQKENPRNVPMAGVKQIMETNFYGPWRMIQVFIPLLLKSDNGQIINMSSGMGELGSLSGDYPSYRISKSSLNALTIMFAKELEKDGISVNAMCPGWVKTDMGGPDAPRDVSQGADTAVWLATENEIATGKFFRDRQEISW